MALKSEELDADDVLGDLVRRGREMSGEEFAEFCEELAALLNTQADAARRSRDNEEDDDE